MLGLSWYRHSIKTNSMIQVKNEFSCKTKFKKIMIKSIVIPPNHILSFWSALQQIDDTQNGTKQISKHSPTMVQQ